jgi:hypothetical protein
MSANNEQPSANLESTGYLPGELDRTAPARVWLQIDTNGDNNDRNEQWPGYDNVTWHEGSIGGLEIQYVRADLAAPVATAPVEPDLDAYDPASGELAAQWLYRNGLEKLAAVLRGQLDIRGARIRELSASTPAAPGIDLADEVDLIRSVLDGYPDSIARADALRAVRVIRSALVDASPKGGSDAKDAARWRAIAPHLRVDWDESDEAQFCMWLHIKDDGVTVSRSPSHMHSTVDDAADLLVSAMQATSAEVGSWSCPRCGSKSGEQCSSCGCFSNEQDASHGAGVSND